MTRYGTMLYLYGRLYYAKMFSQTKRTSPAHILGITDTTHRRQSTYDECIKAIASERSLTNGIQAIYLAVGNVWRRPFFDAYVNQRYSLECLYSCEDFNVLFIEIGWTTMIFDEFIVI